MSDRGTLNWAKARERLERIRQAVAQTENLTPADRDRLFRRRAELLARPERTEHQMLVGEFIVVFRLGSERYGLPVAALAEVIRNAHCDTIPGAAEEIAGVIQVRGEVRVVYDPKRLLGLPDEQLDREQGKDETRSVLLLRDPVREFGLIVDEIEDAILVQEADRLPAPPNSRRVAWMTRDLVTVLEAESLLEGN